MSLDAETFIAEHGNSRGVNVFEQDDFDFVFGEGSFHNGATPSDKADDVWETNGIFGWPVGFRWLMSLIGIGSGLWPVDRLGDSSFSVEGVIFWWWGCDLDVTGVDKESHHSAESKAVPREEGEPMFVEKGYEPFDCDGGENSGDDDAHDARQWAEDLKHVGGGIAMAFI